MKWSHLFCCWYCWIDGIMCYLQSYEQILFFQFLTNNSYKQIVFQISQHPKCYISTDKHFLICILTWVWVSLISRIKEACISLLVKIKYKYGFRWKEESKNRGIPGGFVFFFNHLQVTHSKLSSSSLRKYYSIRLHTQVRLLFTKGREWAVQHR